MRTFVPLLQFTACTAYRCAVTWSRHILYTTSEQKPSQQQAVQLTTHSGSLLTCYFEFHSHQSYLFFIDFLCFIKMYLFKFFLL